MWIFQNIASKLTFYEYTRIKYIPLCFLVILSMLTPFGVGHTTPASAILSIDVIEAPIKKGKRSKVDPQLSSIKESLLKSFPKLSRFKHIKKYDVPFTKGKKTMLAISKGLTVKLTPLTNRKKQLVFKMEVPQKKANFKLKARKGKLFYQAMPWKNKVYILAFKAK